MHERTQRKTIQSPKSAEPKLALLNVFSNSSPQWLSQEFSWGVRVLMGVA